MQDVNLAGKRVFIRADLNVPQDDAGKITDDTRIRASVPAVQHALKAGAAVMVTSHLGRPTEGEFNPADSLAPIAQRMSELLERPVPLARDWVGGVDVQPGSVVMLENCRFNNGEKKNDDALAKKLAALCDVYVTTRSAPRTARSDHRTASPNTRTRVPGPHGCRTRRARQSAARPGPPAGRDRRRIQSSTKLTILKSLREKVDQLIVGGGIANTFMLAMGQRGQIARGARSDRRSARDHRLHESARRAVPLPVDVVVAANCPRARASSRPTRLAPTT
jgi:phosphoglycerate kinase